MFYIADQVHTQTAEDVNVPSVQERREVQQAASVQPQRWSLNSKYRETCESTRPIIDVQSRILHFVGWFIHFFRLKIVQFLRFSLLFNLIICFGIAFRFKQLVLSVLLKVVSLKENHVTFSFKGRTPLLFVHLLRHSNSFRLCIDLSTVRYYNENRLTKRVAQTQRSYCKSS